MAKQKVRGHRANKPNDSFGTVNDEGLYRGKYRDEVYDDEEDNVEVEAQHEVSGLVQSGDKRLTIAAADLLTPPTIADKILIGGIVHQVISVKTVEQDNTAITYELILRA